MALAEKYVAIFEELGALLKEYFSGEAAKLDAGNADATFDPTKINQYAKLIAGWKAETVTRDVVAFKRYDVRTCPVDKQPYWALHDHCPADYGNIPPSEFPTMWAHVHGTSPETARPHKEEAHNLYYKGHYCTEAGKVYRYIAETASHYAPSVLPGNWEYVGDAE